MLNNQQTNYQQSQQFFSKRAGSTKDYHLAMR